MSQPPDPLDPIQAMSQPPDPLDLPDPLVDDQRALECARCRFVLGHARDALEVAGARVHRDLVNPGGHRFTVRLLAAAPGCVAAGQTSDERSWFSGCTWQRAFCRGCTWHVGWLFRSPQKIFWALDSARVRAAP